MDDTWMEELILFHCYFCNNDRKRKAPTISNIYSKVWFYRYVGHFRCSILSQLPPDLIANDYDFLPFPFKSIPFVTLFHPQNYGWVRGRLGTLWWWQYSRQYFTIHGASQCFTIHGAVCHEKATLALWGSAEMVPESSLRAGSRVLTTPFGRK